MNIKEQIEEILLTDYQYVDCYTVQKLLDLFDVSRRSEQCNHVFQRVERGGEFQGNQCECGEWEDLT